MSSTTSNKSARSAEFYEEARSIWEYSANSESVVSASSSCSRFSGCEETSTSGRDGASSPGRGGRGMRTSPLADLFSYPIPVSRQSRETGETVSSRRTPRADNQEGVGTSRPSQNVEASVGNEGRLVIEVPHLRDESLSPAEPPPQVKIEECAWEYNPLVEADRLDAWIGSGLAEVVKKKKTRSRRKQRPPPGCSWCDEDSLAILRQECGIPNTVEMIVPTSEQREDDPPEGTFTAYECWFRDCFLTFPIPSLILRFMRVHKIALAQINTRGVRQLVGLLTRAAECGESIGVRHLHNFLEFRKNVDPSGKKMYNLASRSMYKILDDFPNKDHNWRKSFFFVVVSAASVEEENLVVAKWGTLGRFSRCPPCELFFLCFVLIFCFG